MSPVTSQLDGSPSRSLLRRCSGPRWPIQLWRGGPGVETVLCRMCQRVPCRVCATHINLQNSKLNSWLSKPFVS